MIRIGSVVSFYFLVVLWNRYSERINSCTTWHCREWRSTFFYFLLGVYSSIRIEEDDCM
jgi:hypothetical protein